MGQNFIELHNDKADFTEFLCKVYFFEDPGTICCVFYTKLHWEIQEIKQGRRWLFYPL